MGIKGKLREDYFGVSNSFGLSPTKIYWTCLSFIWGWLLFDLYVIYRQRNVLKTLAKRIPAAYRNRVEPEIVEKDRLQRMGYNTWRMVQTVCVLASMTAFFHFELLFKGWDLAGQVLTATVGIERSDNKIEIFHSFIFSVLAISFCGILYSVIPSILYSRLVNDPKLTWKQELAKSLQNTLVCLAMTYVISGIITLLVILYQTAEEYKLTHWFCIGFFITIFVVKILCNFPMMIAPGFDKYKNLKAGPLRTRIEDLATRLNFPLDKIYTTSWNDSIVRQPYSYSGYFYGFLNRKHLVLYDTLLTKSRFTDQDIEAIVAQLLAKWKLNHFAKTVFFTFVYVTIYFGLFVLFYWNSALYEAFGFPKDFEKPVLLGFIVAYITLIPSRMIWLHLFVLHFRLLEYQADRYVIKRSGLNFKNQLKEALLKCWAYEAFPVYDPFYSAWFRRRPSYLERIQAIEKGCEFCDLAAHCLFPCCC